MQTLYSFAPHFHNLLLNRRTPLIFLSFACFSSASISNLLLFDYFTKQGFPKSRSISLSNRFSHIKSLERAESVIQFFRDLGFSDTQIRSAVRVQPQILFADADRTLKPKVRFFQDLGFSCSNLARFLSKNSSLLTNSLEKKLIPCVEILKKILLNDKNNEELIRVLGKCGWLLARDPRLFLVPNVAFLQSCGIVGSQLLYLLKRQPRLFVTPETKAREFVSRSLDMGFSVNSRMLVYAVYTLSCMSNKTLNKKFQLFVSYGFSHGETMEMFRRAPVLLGVAEEKLKLGLEFFMDSVGFRKEVLVRRPTCLMYSLEERVIPRFNVLEILRLKGLLRKDPSFLQVLESTEKEFVRKFILRFEGDVEELLVGYKGHLLDSSSSSEKESEE